MMNSRAQQVLKVLIERYIQDGLPVSSKLIAEELPQHVSPATVRHILADLEGEGYLTSLHTSSGRVPTGLGYRFFIESLLTVKPMPNTEVEALSRKLGSDLTTPDLLQSASSILSGLTQLTGVISLPRRERIELRQVEFLPLSDRRILVILVLNNREVQNRIIHTDRPYSFPELQQAANYLNAHYFGKELTTIRADLFSTIERERDSMAFLLQTVMDIAGRAFESATESTPDCLIVGQNHLLSYIKEINFERLQVLFAALSQKQDILTLLDHALDADGIQIFIGKESGNDALSDWSVVAKAYSIDGEVVGSLGVIGPLRMPYDRVISAVEVTAQLLSSALNQA